MQQKIKIPKESVEEAHGRHRIGFCGYREEGNIRTFLTGGEREDNHCFRVLGYSAGGRGEWHPKVLGDPFKGSL